MPLEAATDRATGHRVRVPRHDELPSVGAGATDPIAAGRDAAGRVTTSDAARALARLPRRTRYMSREVACDPTYEPHYRRSRDWLRRRRAEYVEEQGGISEGVSALLNAAAHCYAAGEFAAERAARTGDLEGFRVAAALSQTGRGHELSAWELGAKESKRRPPQPYRPASYARVDDDAEPAAEDARGGVGDDRDDPEPVSEAPEGEETP